MTLPARQSHRQKLLSRAFDQNIKAVPPPGVIRWVSEHLRLATDDMKRLKKLYEKAMDESITPAENAELDDLMAASAAMDLLRARMLISAPSTTARGTK